MSDLQFRRYYGVLSLVALGILAAMMLSGLDFLHALWFAGGLLAVGGFTLLGFGLWTRRYRANEDSNG